jgi:hypothetical protein
MLRKINFLLLVLTFLAFTNPSFASVTLDLGINFVSVKHAAMKPPPVRTWTCNGTIALTGTSYSYALPPWQMSGPVTGSGSDREKECKKRIQSYLNDVAIWQKLGIPADQQDSYCRLGGTFRVDYGFDKRPKDWNFTQFGQPSCKCAGPFSFQ